MSISSTNFQESSSKLPYVENLETVLRVIPDLILVMDAGGRFLESYVGGEARLLRPPEEFLGKMVDEVLPPEMAIPCRHHIAAALEQGFSEGHVYSLDFPEGRRWFEAKFSRRDASSVVVHCRDITDRRQVERALRERGELFGKYFDLGLIGMAISSTEKRWVAVNDELCRLLGYPREELVQLRWNEITHPDDLKEDEDQFNLVLRGEIDGYKLTKRFIRKDGNLMIASLSVTCSRRLDGSVDSFFVLVSDITEQRTAEIAMERHRVRLQRLNELTSDSMISEEEKIRVALRMGCEWFQMSEATICKFVDAETCETTYQHPTDFRIETHAHPSSGRSCREMLGESDTVVLSELSADTQEKGGARKGNYMSTLLVLEGKKYGALTFLGSGRARKDLRCSTDLEDFKLLSRWIASKLEGISHVNELVQARTVAEVASETKSRFMANVSHEIRTPLCGVVGLADILAKGYLEEPERGYVQGIQVSARALLSVINDILDFSKIESGTLRYDPRECEIAGVINEVRDVLTPSAQRKGIPILIKIDDNVPGVLFADPVRLRQVLTNLVDNALKFSDRGSILIRVNRRLDGTRPILQFEVEDSGQGIPPGKEQEIFEPFVQADTSSARQYGGTGLGLSIAKRVVEMWGGEIGVRPKGGAPGSIFWFTLHEEAYRPSVMEFAHRSQETSAQVEVQPLRILLAEDNLINQKVISIILRGLNHEVVGVENGLQAIEKLKTESFDLILMDCQMPQLDGYETTAWIRENERVSGTHIPIVALTAHALKGDREKCLARGMDGYLSKPIDEKKMTEEIARVLREREKSVELGVGRR